MSRRVGPFFRGLRKNFPGTAPDAADTSGGRDGRRNSTEKLDARFGPTPFNDPQPGRVCSGERLTDEEIKRRNGTFRAPEDPQYPRIAKNR